MRVLSYWGEDPSRYRVVSLSPPPPRWFTTITYVFQWRNLLEYISSFSVICWNSCALSVQLEKFFFLTFVRGGSNSRKACWVLVSVFCTPGQSFSTADTDSPPVSHKWLYDQLKDLIVFEYSFLLLLEKSNVDDGKERRTSLLLGREFACRWSHLFCLGILVRRDWLVDRLTAFNQKVKWKLRRRRCHPSEASLRRPLGLRWKVQSTTVIPFHWHRAMCCCM